MLFRLKDMFLLFAALGGSMLARANGDDHFHPVEKKRRLGIFHGSPPGLCKDGDPTFTVGGVIYECEGDFNAKGGQCKTLDKTEEEKARKDAAFKKWKENKQKGGPKGKGRYLEGCLGGVGCVDWEQDIITVPTYFHIIHDGPTGRKYTFDGYPESDPSYIIEQIRVVNKGFRGIETDYPQNGNGRSYERYLTEDSDTRIQFCLMGTTSTDNARWYRDKGNYKPTLDVGGLETLNVFVNTASGYLGYAYSPRSSDFAEDGVVLLNDSMPNNTGRYGEGDTLTHEIGHWLDLDHTHYQSCSGPGDYMDDAEPSPNYVSITANENDATYNCPVNLDDCTGDQGRPNPIHNFMAYTQDNCMDEFSPGQKERMRAAWELYRHKEGYSETIALDSDGYSCVIGGSPTTSPVPPPTANPTLPQTPSPTSSPVPPPTANPTFPQTPSPTAKPVSCNPVGAGCVVNSDCCGNKCRGKAGAKTCK